MITKTCFKRADLKVTEYIFFFGGGGAGGGGGGVSKTPRNYKITLYQTHPNDKNAIKDSRCYFHILYCMRL